MKKIISTLFLVFLTVAAARAETTPDRLVRETTDKILVPLKVNRDSYAKDHQKLYAMVDEHVLPNFDFRTMSKSVLARHWREATEDQRARFTQEFRNLLVRTYATALLKYTDQEIVYLPYRDKPGEKTVVVKTEVKQGGGGPSIPIHYNFYNTDSAWKVVSTAITICAPRTRATRTGSGAPRPPST